MLAGRSTIAALAVAGVITMGAALPVVGAAESLPDYTGDEFSRLFSVSVGEPARLPPDITGAADVDARIRDVAEARGYELRPVAEGPMEWVDGHLLRPEAAAAWRRLADAASDAGYPIGIVSGFRDLASQRSLFLRRLAGTSEAAINLCLRWTAPPGYSKHHTGLAVDLAALGSGAGSFGSSGAYAWLTADGYRNALRFGFIPSYPPDATSVGPNPEPWEWVFVGTDAITTGFPDPAPPSIPFRPL